MSTGARGTGAPVASELERLVIDKTSANVASNGARAPPSEPASPPHASIARDRAGTSPEGGESDQVLHEDVRKQLFDGQGETRHEREVRHGHRRARESMRWESGTVFDRRRGRDGEREDDGV